VEYDFYFTVEEKILWLDIPSSGSEGDTIMQGTVSIPGILAGDLVVSLASDDGSEVTVPVDILIAGGHTSASFDVTIVDDGELDGNQTVTVTASAAGWIPDTLSITVADNDDVDSDGDGMPDVWEVENNLDPFTNDAHDDGDGDGFSNLTEYRSGTDPNDADSHPPVAMPWLQLLLGE
jgi:hypothetical protein